MKKKHLHSITSWRGYLVICNLSLVILLTGLILDDVYYDGYSLVIIGFSISLFLIIAPLVLKLILPRVI